MKRFNVLTRWIQQIEPSRVKKDILIGAIAGITLTAIFITFQLGGWQTVAAEPPLTIPEIARNASLPKTPLTIESSTEDVIALMLNSHTQWHTLQAHAITTINNQQLDDNSWQTNIELEQYGKGRGDYSRVGNESDFAWVSDGNTLWKVKPTANVYSEISLPEDVKTLENYGPTSPPTEDNQAFIVRHPLDGVFPSMLSSFAFPHGLAQSFQQQVVEIVGSDIVAERDTVIVLSQVFDDEGNLVKKHEYWIDTDTGVILKNRVYAESSGWDKWYEQTTVTEIVYDVTFPARTFQFKSEHNMRQVSPDDFDSARINQ